MSGGNISKREVHRQVPGIDAICHARLKVFHEMVEKETGWKHLYYD